MEAPTQNIEADFSGLDAVQQTVQGQNNLDTALLQQIRSEATPAIKLAAIDRLMGAHKAGEEDKVITHIYLARVLGMEAETPEGAKIINALSNFYGLEQPQPAPQEEDLSDVPNPSRRRFLKKIPVATAGLALIAAGSSPPNTGSRSSESVLLPPKTPIPESPIEQVNSFNELIRPFIEAAFRRREAWAKSDPEFYQRVDKELNANLISIAVPAWSEGRGEALTVITYNLLTGKATSVSCTRETITPEAIRFNKLKHPGRKDIYSLGIGTNMFLYGTGGFDLVRRVIQDETGLAADFVVYVDDMAVHDFIRDVAGNKVEIEVKDKLHLKDADFDKRWGWDPNGFIVEPGEHEMTATQAMRYILASDIETKPGKGNQPPGRKKDILKAAFHAASARFRQDGKGTIANALLFFTKQKLGGRIDADFDIGMLAGLAAKIPVATSGESSFGLPDFEPDDVMINDEFFGDGGLMRVHRFLDEYGEPSQEYYKYAHPNMQRLVDKTIEIIKELRQQRISIDDVEQRALVERGGLPMWAQVPILGDPDTPDPVTGWWPSTRKLVKDRLSGSN